MPLIKSASVACLAGLLLGCAQTPAKPDLVALQQEVFAAERAFAKTMADRDHAAFASWLAAETVFYGGKQVLRGKATVAAAWKGFYEEPAAPFSWEPEQVDVLESGTLAHSSGPVRDPDGKIFNTYNSVWRREAPGVWRVVFDKGCRVCEDCAAEKKKGTTR